MSYSLTGRQSGWMLGIGLIVFSLWRLWSRQIAGVDLFFDEAYYWGWAQTPDWGYYSKPPVVAWLIYITTHLLGDNMFAVRLGSAILYPLTALVIYWLGLKLFAFSARKYAIALIGALTFMSLPVIAFGSWFITTDAPLLFFWALSLLFYVRALDSNSWRDWILLGLCAALGLLSKYTMVFFVPCALMHLLVSNQLAIQLRNPRLYVAAGLATLLFLPNIWWNYQHQFSSYKHTAEISQLDKHLINPAHFGEFFAAQFAVFGFVLFGGLIAALFRLRSLLTNPPMAVLLSFSFVPVALFCLLAFTSRAFANWAAFAYVAAALFIAAWWMQLGRHRLLASGLLANFLLIALLSHWQWLAGISGVELSRKSDPYFRVKAWQALAKKIEPEFARYPQARLLGVNRDMLAEMSFYIGRNHQNARHPLIYNPSGEISNHYALVADIANQPGGQFLWVSSQDEAQLLPAIFAKAELLAEVKVPIYRHSTTPNSTRSAYVWLVENFHGGKVQ